MEINENVIAINITRKAAFQMEEVEKNAWCDMYEAAPHGFADYMRIFQSSGDKWTLISADIPLGLFNRVFMHGLTTELKASDINSITSFFSAQNVSKYHIYTTPFSMPSSIDRMLESNGLTIVNATDKMFCELNTINLPQDNPPDLRIKLVEPASAAAWADFICETYGGLPNQPWLIALVNRKDWHHAVAEQDKKIIACRSMYIDNNKNAWLGIDAPIPGVMTNHFEPDYHLCKKLLEIAKYNGVHLVNSCVEAIDKSRQTSAYSYYFKLGFKIAYLRKNYSLKN